MNKTIIKGLSLVLVLSNLLSGCKKADSKEFKPSLDKNLTANLEIEGFFDNFEALDQVVNAFNEYYPNVSVSYERVPCSKLREFMENNQGVDIFMTSSQNFNQEDNEKYVGDYCLDYSSEKMNLSAYRENLIKAYTINDRLISLPIFENVSGLIVNKTLLEKEGLTIPTNQEEFLNCLAVLKEKGYTPIQSALNHVYSNLVYSEALTLIGNNGQLSNQLNRGNVENIEMLLPIFETIETMVNEGYSDLTLNETYPSDNYDKAILKFFEGDVTFWPCTGENASGMKKRESKSESFKNTPFKYEFIYSPIGEKGAYGYEDVWGGFSINKNTNKKDLAIEFMNFLSQEENLNLLANTKGMPSVAKNRDNAFYTNLDNEKLIEESYQDEGIISLSTKSKIADVCNQYANGNYSSAKEVLEALSKKIEEAK